MSLTDGIPIALALLLALASSADAPPPLRNQQTSLRFAQTQRGFTLQELRCTRPERDFIASQGDPGALWRLSLRPPTYAEADEIALDSAAPCRLAGSHRNTAAGAELTLRWLGLSLPGEPNALDVTVTITLAPGEALSQWRIAVANRSTKLGLWTVDFPRLPDLTVAPSGTLAVPLGWGALLSDPVKNGNHVGNYPSLFCSLQLTSLADRGACLYVASHDPDGYLKQVHWQAHPDQGRVEYFLRQYPPDMGQPAKSYQSPYPVAIGFLRGDWLDAAKRYREWALAHAPWMPKAPLERSAASPEWLKRTALWLQSNGHGTAEPGDSLLNCIAIKRAMPDIAIADQLYWWQKELPGQAEFDEGYPDQFLELGRGEAEVKALREVRAAGVRMAPYTNPNLVDARTKYWKEGGWRWAALPPEQAHRHDAWIADLNRQATGAKPVNIAMCPYAPQRGDVVVAWARKIVGEFGFDGVYLDQVACIEATPCFDPSHGHPLGGGAYWVQGYRQMLTRVQQAIRAIKPDAILTTESACEPFGVFDAYLRCNEDQGWVAPIWSAVYGGRLMSYGSYLYDMDNVGGTKYAAKFAQLFTYGAQLGWLGAQHKADPSEPWFAYLHELARARTAGVRWIGMGEWLRPPTITGCKQATGRWRMFASEYDVTWQAILGGAYQAADGTTALAFTNYTTEPQQCSWHTSLRDLKLPAAQYTARAIYPVGAAPSATQQGEAISGDLTMAPLSVVVLELQRK